MELTQASTALSIVVPGGVAVGAAGRTRCCAAGASRRAQFGRAVMLVGLWNQLLNLSYPIVAVFLLATVGEESEALATVAFVGVAMLRRRRRRARR